MTTSNHKVHDDNDEIQIEALQQTVGFLTDPERAAQMAGLRYVSDSAPGYERKPWGRGFTFLNDAGEHIRDEALRARFEALAIPPAWTDVWICADEQGHLQVTGRDDAGRKQYIYHPQWEEMRSQAKFNRMIPFAHALPLIRRQVDKDLRRHGLPRPKVLAIVVYLLEEARIRIGNPQYAKRNNTHGLTTLSDDHLEITGSRIHFEFVGKSGKKRAVDIRDRRVARHLRKCQELPGQQLFQYVDGEGKPHTIDSDDVNDYLRTITRQSFTAKDFRTWAGTVLMLDELFEQGEPTDEKEAKQNIVAAVKAVAGALGNTPAVCRNYYVHPSILEAFQDGSLFTAIAEAAAEETHSAFDLSPDERAVLKILCRNTRLTC